MFDGHFVAEIGRTTAGQLLWMVELSVPDLFAANRRKVAEVLILTRTEPGSSRDLRSFLLARVPGCFVTYAGGDAERATFKFPPSGVSGHVPLYGCE
jgi:hypothetical protein